jgi:hypothetical protein
VNDYAEALSLALTWPTVVIGVGVLVHWRQQAWEAWEATADKRTPTQWLILGIAVGFLGSVLDNIYWGVAWTADFAELSSRDFWFRNGVWPNIPFRQVAGAYAAYCHLRSYYAASKAGNRKLVFYVVLSLLLGVAYVGVCSLI